MRTSFNQCIQVLEQQQRQFFSCNKQTLKHIPIPYSMFTLKTCAGDAGEAVTQQGLDTRCELWLDQVFGLKLDFAIENSLPVCLEDGVIERDAQVLLLLKFSVTSITST